MKRSAVFRIIAFALLGICFIAPLSRTASGQTIRQAVESEMPVLKGSEWVTMDDNAKVAFIWGVGHVVVIEQVIMEEYPDQKRDTFVTKVVEASNASPATMTQVAAAIDKFYADNPDKLDTPVMAVIWDTMVKPNVKTGIAGQPLK